MGDAEPPRGPESTTSMRHRRDDPTRGPASASMTVFSSHAARSWLVNTHASTASRGRVAPASHSAFIARVIHGGSTLAGATRAPRSTSRARLNRTTHPPHDTDSDIRPPPPPFPIDPATSSTQVVAKVTPKEAQFSHFWDQFCVDLGRIFGFILNHFRGFLRRP